jgi:predicted RNA-binding Zn-ribbon protein involved in translation (DUF1610 family)
MVECMSPISEETAKQIQAILEERGVKSACPRCGSKEFAVIVEGYLANLLQPSNLKGVTSVQGPNVPSVALVCKNCGFISQHALGVLGFLPQKNTK